jgi:hypothetical protein
MRAVDVMEREQPMRQGGGSATCSTRTATRGESHDFSEHEQGYAVFVGVPGHYKSAVGGNRERFDYDDPLGFGAIGSTTTDP